MRFNYKDLFAGKRVTLMGLGLLGRGVGDAIFLAKAGADLTVTDLKSEADLEKSLRQLRKFKNIKFVLGEHRLEDFKNADIVIKAAGVPLNSPFIEAARKNKVPVMMSTEIFARNTPAQVVGVTGTRGKSTVAHLLYEIFKLHQKTAGKVFLGGNILGVSTLSELPKTKAGDIAVLELDSWQLQGFSDFSPKLSVFTTFMSDHMNYYAGDMAHYFADKANIYKSQKAEDVLVVSEDVLKNIEKFGPKPVGKVIVARANDVPNEWKIKIPGEHNKLNIALAVEVARAYGVSEKNIQKAVESFKAVPGRLELVRKYKGIEIYNDTNSTTPDATLAGLGALGQDKKIVLIFGGADKKLDPARLISKLPEYVKAMVVLPGSGTDKIKAELEKISTDFSIPLFFAKDMNEAVQHARGFSVSGDKILMSPAFASFGLFKNEYDRGDKFNEAVKKLK
jgi:UDP-N-acetylmuramoylalanine--D-glutamate ligase